MPLERTEDKLVHSVRWDLYFYVDICDTIVHKKQKNNTIFNKCDAKIALISELALHCRCVFNRNAYVTFYTVRHSGKSYGISMLVCNAAIPVIYILAAEGMLAM